MLNHPELPEEKPFSYELSINLHDCKFPVIKIDFEGTILYANKAAFGLIQDWGCAASRKLPMSVLKNHPEILSHNANAETELASNNRIVKFNIVAFDEAGYTGLYGYEMKMIA